MKGDQIPSQWENCSKCSPFPSQLSKKVKCMPNFFLLFLFVQSSTQMYKNLGEGRSERWGCYVTVKSQVKRGLVHSYLSNTYFTGQNKREKKTTIKRCRLHFTGVSGALHRFHAPMSRHRTSMG